MQSIGEIGDLRRWRGEGERDSERWRGREEREGYGWEREREREWNREKDEVDCVRAGILMWQDLENAKKSRGLSY